MLNRCWEFKLSTDDNNLDMVKTLFPDLLPTYVQVCAQIQLHAWIATQDIWSIHLYIFSRAPNLISDQV